VTSAPSRPDLKLFLYPAWVAGRVSTVDVSSVVSHEQ